MLGPSTSQIHLSETQDLTVGSREEGYGRGGDSLKTQLAAISCGPRLVMRCDC